MTAFGVCVAGPASETGDRWNPWGFVANEAERPIITGTLKRASRKNTLRLSLNGGAIDVQRGITKYPRNAPECGNA